MMAFINPALLAAPLPFKRPADIEAQRADTSLRTNQARSFELGNISAEQKQELEQDIQDYTRGLAFARAGDMVNAEKTLTGNKDELLTSLWGRIATNGFDESTERFLTDINAALGQAGIDVPDLKSVAPGAALVDPRDPSKAVFTNPKPEAEKDQFEILSDAEVLKHGLDPSGVYQKDNSGKIFTVQGAKGQSEAGDGRSRRISDVMRLHGLTEAQAVSLEDGHVKSVINDKTGRVVTLDDIAAITGQEDAVVEQAVSGGSQLPPPSPAPGETIVEQMSLVQGPIAGIATAFQEAAQLLGIPSDARMTEAKQNFMGQFQALIRTMSTNPDGRVMKEEMSRIREEFGIPVSFWTGVETGIDKAKGLDKALRVRMEQALATMGNPSFPDVLRQQRAIQYEAIRNFLPVLGVDRLGQEDEFTDELNAIDAELQALGASGG